MPILKPAGHYRLTSGAKMATLPTERLSLDKTSSRSSPQRCCRLRPTADMDDDNSDDQRRCTKRWVQVNNTVVPVVQRTTSDGQTLSYIPLPVVKHGAGLFPDRDPDAAVKSTPAECRLLSDLCLEAGFRFEFPRDTELILLDEITKRYRDDVYVAKLPDRDPFVHAEFWPHTRNGALSGMSDNTGTRTSSPGSDCDKRSGRDEDKNDVDKDREEVVERAIWRPVSFSPDHEVKKPTHQLLDSADYPDKPLDLSLRSTRAKREPVGDRGSLKKINNKRSHSRTVRRSHKQEQRHSLHFQERHIFGQPIITMENNNKEYVSLSCLRHAFFPTIPSFAFPSIVAAVEGRIAELEGPRKDETNREPDIDRLLSADDKMIEFSEAERTIIGVGAFVQTMTTNSPLMEPSLVSYCLPFSPYPLLVPEVLPFQAGPLPPDALSSSPVIVGRRQSGAKLPAIPDVRDITNGSIWHPPDSGRLSRVGGARGRMESANGGKT